MPVAWGSDHEASSDQCSAAPAPDWPRTAAATRDWNRREHRRACRQLGRHQRVEVSLSPPAVASPRQADMILSRAQRAHARLSWAERLARNARDPTAGRVTIKLFGSVWQQKHRRNAASSATVSLFLGQLCFSEWSLVTSFPGFSSLLLLFCPFRSPSLCISPCSRAGYQFCTTFAQMIKD